VWRIGFTGELSFELHVPAAYGRHVWERLLDLGGDLGVAPFGVEAQRILRLEKGHVIVSQDTDGLTGPYEIGMGDLVRLDKADFMGKPELAWREVDPSGAILVGLRPVGDTVPDEASLVVDGRDIVGRVTSSRWSPTLGAPICLGFVSAAQARPGTEVTIVLPSGGRLNAVVQEHHAHFDPEGTRLHA
jgi:sarcosine oxidase, subunit alpha